MKRFIKINESFVCAFCGHKNPPAQKTCRNHCRMCLCSLHIDVNPGDRAEECHGKMIPLSIEIKGGVVTDILFQCENCGMVRKNKIAEDDNKEKFPIGKPYKLH